VLRLEIKIMFENTGQKVLCSMISEDKYKIEPCYLTFLFATSILGAPVRARCFLTLPRLRLAKSNSDSGILTPDLRAGPTSDFQHPISGVRL
jgi:hypothetical protein